MRCGSGPRLPPVTCPACGATLGPWRTVASSEPRLAGRRIAEGRTLVSTTFVVPYPPGFPVLVPGQVVSKEILYFLAQLDVKEIHGVGQAQVPNYWSNVAALVVT